MTTYNSGFSISNDPTDLDYAQIDAGTATVWPPSRDAKLTRSPVRQADGEYLPFDGGAVYRRRSATFTAIGIRRDISAPSLNTKSKTKAAARAVADLAKVADQDHRITCAVDLPSAVATKIKAGMAINFRSTYLPGYMGAWRACRIVHCQPKQAGAGSRWILDLELVPIVDGDADVVTVEIAASLRVGNNTGGNDHDWASSHGVSGVTLVVGKQYRIAFTTTAALNVGTGLTYSAGIGPCAGSGRRCDIMIGNEINIVDGAGSTTVVTTPTYIWDPQNPAPVADWTFAGPSTQRYGGAQAGIDYPCGFPGGTPVGYQFTGPWATFQGPAVAVDLEIKSNAISGFYGQDWGVDVELQSR